MILNGKKGDVCWIRSSADGKFFPRKIVIEGEGTGQDRYRYLGNLAGRGEVFFSVKKEDCYTSKYDLISDQMASNSAKAKADIDAIVLKHKEEIERLLSFLKDQS